MFKLNKKLEERKTLFLKTNILWSFKLDCMHREAWWPSGRVSDSMYKVFSQSAMLHFHHIVI